MSTIGSYLASRDELEGSQSGLEVWDVGLKIVQGGCNGSFRLGRVLS
jgi:hypothetical protein